MEFIILAFILFGFIGLGLTIIPLVLFTNDKGLAKITIALCRGKREFDKRDDIKDRDNKRDLSRLKKSFNN